ncbi:hypothetical protein ACHAWF_010321 [Thalassiosira exigua]
MNDLLTFCKALPKVELHAHLNGSIRQHTLVELAHERNVTLPKQFLLHEAAAGSEALFFNTKPRSLLECFEIFSYIPKCVNDLAALRRITNEVLEDAADDNVAYIELRTGPKVLLRDHQSAADGLCTKKQYVDTIIEVMDAFERKEHERYQTACCTVRGSEANKCSEAINRTRPPLIPRLIISVDRAGTLDQAVENIELATEMFQSPGNKYIVGVELGGNPTRNDFRTFEAAFDSARRRGLPVAIHCGEVPTGSNELEEDLELLKAYQEASAIIEFKPDRLGHALLLPDSLIEKLWQQPIPIECCPTSNVMTLELALHRGGNLIDGLKMHPQLGKWLEGGDDIIEQKNSRLPGRTRNRSYPISVNTDDSGLFCTNLSKELFLVAAAFDLCENKLAGIMLDAVAHSFCSDDIKSIVRTHIEKVATLDGK